MKSLLRHLFGLMVGIALANGALAQVPMTGTGNYVQDFNSLVNTGTGTWVNGGATPSIPNFYAQRTGTGTSIAANNGASNAGNLYSYGTGTNVDRSLGSLGSGNAAAGNFAWGIELRNTGTAAITDMTVSYTGEQWRNSAAAAQTVSFYYRVSASSNTDLNPNVTTGWTAVPALNFTSPITGGTAGALDGNAAANRIAFSAVAIVGINVPAGSYLMFKWDDPDQTGADHGVSIDDLTITWGSGPADVPPTVTTVVPANGAVGVAENTNIDLTFSEAVTATGNWVTVTGSLSGARTPASGLTVTGGPTTFTLDPDTDFTLGETVTVTVTAANVADQDGTPNNLAADFTSSFTVVPPVTTIAAAKAQPFGSLVAVTGVVTVANQFGGQVFIQDATGGIGIFDNTAPFLNEDPALLIGRELTVQGTLSEFQPTTGVPGSGLTQISPVTSYTIGATVGVPAPKVVTMNGLTEADEAVLVQVNNVAIPERGLVIPNSSYNGVDATGPGVLRIQNTTFSNLGILGQVLPARSSAVVGVLGQFRGTYQVQPRLPGDIAGAGAASPSFGSTPESETLDVITINAEWFGHPSNGPGGTAPGTADAQRTAMTTLLNNLQADVYFLQEVNNVAQFNTLVANMPGYAARLVTDCFSNRPASPTAAEIDEGQKLAFIYKTSVITPDAAVNGGQPLCYLSSFSVPADYPAPFGTLATADPGRFWASGRFPVVFVVDATVNGVTRKLHLINIHARANGGGAEALERYAMRRFDFNALYTQLAIDYPNANIVMAGDYNDDVDVTVSDNPLNGTTTLADFMNDPTNYRVVTYPLSLDKWRSFASQFNMIDHITVSNELFDNQLVKTELVVDGYSILPTTRFHSTVTDHLPVKARLSLADIPTWNGTAWSPAAPVANQNARINGNFNTATDGNGLAPGNLTINSPATLTIAENNSFTVNGILSYPGNLTVQSGGSLVQAAGSTLGTTTGTFSALRAVGTKPAPGYNFISSPVAGATFNGIGSSPNPDRFFRYDPTVLPVGQNQWVALPGTSTLLAQQWRHQPDPHGRSWQPLPRGGQPLPQPAAALGPV
ncbi:MAG: Ig-like domain-containing protein [Bernardetiaceae bacterium]|nr:Ig-like domain-containing protein [Bernardetiaceae bacterium]